MTVTFYFYVFLTVSISVVFGLPDFNHINARNFESLVHEFEIPDAKKVDNFNKPPVTLKAFSWRSCSKPGAIVDVTSLSISPDPLGFPGPLDVSASFNLKQNLASQLVADLVVEKKIFGAYVKIPCIDGFGSCEYPDLCKVLAPIKDQCPDPLRKIGLTCQCPIKKGTYKLPKTEFAINADIIPSGDYKIQATVSMNKKPVVCLQLTISLQ